MHSNASDGALAPKEVARKVYEAGISAFSLTDHDTLAGLDEAKEAADDHGLEFLPGLEMSLEFKGQPLHLLVYGQLKDSPEVLALVSVIQGRSRTFLEEFRKALAGLGVGADLGNRSIRSVGKMLAALRVLVVSVKKEEAKQIWSQARKQASDNMDPPLDVTKALEVLLPGNVLVALAHPAKGPGQGALGMEEVRALRDMGLQGLEAFHGRHDDTEQKFYEKMAKDLGLSCVGGSDCHFRSRWPNLGSGGVNRDVYEEIKQRTLL